MISSFEISISAAVNTPPRCRRRSLPWLASVIYFLPAAIARSTIPPFLWMIG